MAMSQFIPDIRIGYLYTYWGPLGFVLMVTICREAVDDFRRHKRDKEVNGQKYYRLVRGRDNPELVPSSKLRVGDMVSKTVQQLIFFLHLDLEFQYHYQFFPLSFFFQLY